MYAVMGITGNVGGAVARTLLAKGEKVRGIVRNPEKAAEWQKQGVELFKAALVSGKPGAGAKFGGTITNTPATPVNAAVSTSTSL